MVIGLRLRTNEREVTWRYPVAVLGGGMWKGLKEAGREDDERIKVWLVVVLGYTRIRGDERRQRYDEKKRERERKRGMGWGGGRMRPVMWKFVCAGCSRYHALSRTTKFPWHVIASLSPHRQTQRILNI